MHPLVLGFCDKGGVSWSWLFLSQRPDTLAVASDPSNLPVLDSLTATISLDGPRGPVTHVAEQYLNGDLVPVPSPMSPDPPERDDTAIGGPPYERKKTRLVSFKKFSRPFSKCWHKFLEYCE